MSEESCEIIINKSNYTGFDATDVALLVMKIGREPLKIKNTKNISKVVKLKLINTK